MTRPALAIIGIVWLVAGVAAVVLGLAGSDWIVSRLPPLAIEADAVGGALTAIGLAFVAAAALHGAVVIGLGLGHRWAVTAGILLSASGCVGMLGIAASAATSSARLPDQAVALGAGALIAVLTAAAYAWCTGALLRRRGRPGSSGGAI